VRTVEELGGAVGFNEARAKLRLTRDLRGRVLEAPTSEEPAVSSIEGADKGVAADDGAVEDLELDEKSADDIRGGMAPGPPSLKIPPGPPC
jgi:hypothetical protein